MVLIGDVGDQIPETGGDCFDEVVAERGMGLHDVVFILGQTVGLRQDCFFDKDFTDIVQDASNAEGFESSQ